MKSAYRGGVQVGGVFWQVLAGMGVIIGGIDIFFFQWELVFLGGTCIGMIIPAGTLTTEGYITINKG